MDQKFHEKAGDQVVVDVFEKRESSKEK